jgi:hypothetical protein
MVRDANFADIPAIVTLLQEAYDRSHYVKDGDFGIDVKETKRLLVQALQRHGGRHGGATWVQVAESNGQVTGLIVGTLARFYSIGTKLMATDLFFVASRNVEPSDPLKLMRGMIEWAKGCPDVIEIKCGTTAVIRDDPREAGRILERLGMKEYGVIYRMEVAR